MSTRKSVLLTLFALLWASPALANAPVLMVAPFDTADREAGYAAMLRTVGALRARGDVAVIHPKLYTRAVEVREGKLKGTTPEQLVDAIAKNVGADHIVGGKIVTKGKEITLKLAIRKIGGKETAVWIDPGALMTVLDKIPLNLAVILAKARLPIVPTEVDMSRITPRTKDTRALLAYAVCHRNLMQQPVGIRSPIVLDEKLLKRTIELCETAKKLDNEMPDPRAALGFAYALAGERKNAELHLSSVRQEKAFLPYYWIGKYWVLAKHYDPQAALSSLRTAIEINPGFLLARGYLGDTLSALGQQVEAQLAFEEYLRAVPNQPWVMARIGYIHSKRKEPKEAMEWTTKALRLAPSDSELLLEMAGRLIDQKRYDAAITILKRLVGDGGARGEVYLRMGYAHLEKGDLDAAQREFNEAITRSTHLAEWRTRGRARYDLAKIWMQLDNPDNALRQLHLAVDEGFRDRKILKSDPDFKPLLKNRKLKKLLQGRLKKNVKRPIYSTPFNIHTESGAVNTKKRRGKTPPITF